MEIIEAFKSLEDKIDMLMNMVDQIDQGMANMTTARVTTLDSITSISASTEENYSLSDTIGTLLNGHEKASQKLEDISKQLQDKSESLQQAIEKFRV